jgi:hypothetical protein
MGWEGFQQFYAKKEQFNIVVLLRDSDKNRKLFAPYMNDPAVKIVWGDLKNYDITLSTSSLGIEKCADIIVELYKTK